MASKSVFLFLIYIMTTIKPNLSFTVLRRGLDSGAAQELKRRLSQQIDISKDLDKFDDQKIKKVQVVAGEVGTSGYEFTSDGSTLKISQVLDTQVQAYGGLKQFVESLQSGLENQGEKEDRVFIDETLTKNASRVELAPDEENAHASLHNVADILDRAYNRRTTLTSWIIYHTFKFYGFKEDDFDPIKNTLKDPEFAKVFAEYKRRAEIDSLDAQKFLSAAFQKEDGEVESKIKQKLVKNALFLINNYNKLNLDFVKLFPKVFCIQNVAMPFLKWLCPNVKLFDFMVTVNPWIYDLVSENMGNYVGEIEAIQNVSNPKDKILSEIKLSPLTYKEFSLQNIIKNISNGFERILGKESTVSSIIVNKVLKDNNYNSFQEFAKEFTEDTKDDGFIKKLYEGLKESSGSDVPENKFSNDHKKSWGAKIIWGITSFARSIPAKKIKEYSNMFGAIFVPLNLAMPLLAKVFDKGLLGFVTNSALKIFPIANELLFDNLANFRKEMLDIQKETSNESIASLFPEINPKATYEACTSSLSNLYGTVKAFFNKKFSPDIEIVS